MTAITLNEDSLLALNQWSALQRTHRDKISEQGADSWLYDLFNSQGISCLLGGEDGEEAVIIEVEDQRILLRISPAKKEI